MHSQEKNHKYFSWKDNIRICIIVFLPANTLNGYGQNGRWYYGNYITVRNAHSHVSIEAVQKQIQVFTLDSVSFIQEMISNNSSDTTEYYFNLKDDFAYSVDQSNDTSNYRFIDSKSLWIGDANYKIYKYFYSFQGEDGDYYLFFNPRFGVILHISTAWYNYMKLASIVEIDESQIVPFLIELILYDDEFTRSPISKYEIDSLRFKEPRRKLDSLINSYKEESLKELQNDL